jgi:hypothetical protein
MDKDEIIKELQEKNTKLEEQLNKYLLKNKTYYEKNKDDHIQKVKEYQKRTNYTSKYIVSPEKKKEYARQAYLNKKEKIQKEIEDKNKSENI